MNVMSILPSGEGSIKKAAELLKEKLAKEGLFEPERKRLLPYPPETIGLIASKQSAAYADFIKIINARWHGISISHIDVQVQGEVAPEQIVQAIEQMNSLLSPPEILVIIRGGGSPEDLAAFSSENVTRAVAASRVPTVVAVGHEIDISLAELAADLRASTPSNAAELIVPDKTQIVEELNQKNEFIIHSVIRRLSSAMQEINGLHVTLDNQVDRIFAEVKYSIGLKKQLINAYNPQEVLKLGYAIVKTVGQAVVKSSSQLKVGDNVNVALKNGGFEAKVSKLN
jgi:exodeoxyribonuclease VII large subunit